MGSIIATMQSFSACIGGGGGGAIVPTHAMTPTLDMGGGGGCIHGGVI